MRFRDHRVVGDILELAARYRDEGADELVFYDITASPEGRSVDREWVRRVARVLDIPFCVAGGIRSVADAEAVLNAGAEKISVNSPALADPPLIDALSARFGAQCVVVGIDSHMTPDGYRVYQFTGDPNRTRDSGRDTLALGARSAGARRGRDRAQLHGQRRRAPGLRHRAASAPFARCASVPLVASGGAGTPEHFRDVFAQASVDAALAASVFHSGAIVVRELKQTLRAAGIEVRP